MTDVYFFSYPRHEKQFLKMLPTFRKYVTYDNAYVVWDDVYLEPDGYEPPFNKMNEALGDELGVIRQSEIYDWNDYLINHGWHRQQMAKLLMKDYAKTQYNLICDSELEFINPYVMFEDDEPILYYDKDINSPEFFEFIEKYLHKQVNLDEGTFIGSCSLWDKNIVQQIWDDAQRINGMNLIECMEDHMRVTGKTLCFCEFEMFGVYARDVGWKIKPRNYQYLGKKKPGYVCDGTLTDYDPDKELLIRYKDID